MKLPDYPVPGQPIPASWGREVVDYLRSLTPVASPTVLPQQTPGGTSFTALAPRRFAALRPRDSVAAAGNHWPRSTWVGTVSRWLAVYRDGTTAPHFISKETWEASKASGMPANAEYFDLEADDLHVDGF